VKNRRQDRTQKEEQKSKRCVFKNPSVPPKKERTTAARYIPLSMQDPPLMPRSAIQYPNPAPQILGPSKPIPTPFLSYLAAILRTLTALKAALAPLLTHKATTQRRQTRRQTTPVLFLLARRLLRRRLLVLHRLLLALRRVVAHGLLGRVALLRVAALAAVAVWRVSKR